MKRSRMVVVSPGAVNHGIIFSRQNVTTFFAVQLSFRVAIRTLSFPFQVVYFRSEIKLQPRPDRSPLGDEFKFLDQYLSSYHK